MLAAAYSNTDWWIQRTTFTADQAVAALARRDAAAAEDLAAALMTPQPLDDIEILGAAVEAGLDTTGWEERRAKNRAYTRDAYQLAATSDPDTEAQRIWASLYDNYPMIAAALAGFLRDLPDNWREDLFTTGPYSCRGASNSREKTPGPETAPYDPMDWEDCKACMEAQDQCRYHRGVSEGMQYQAGLIKTLLNDYAAIDYVQERHAELERRAQQTAPASEEASS